MTPSSIWVGDDENLGAALPTETEIYILPDGQVIFADLPAELSDLAAQLGTMQPCALTSPDDEPANR